MPSHTTRRDVLAMIGTAGIAGMTPVSFAAQEAPSQKMPTRAHPATGEQIPVIGFGSSKAVSELGASGPSDLTEVLRTLLAHGGKVVDTWPRDPANDAAFGRIIAAPELQELFITTKIDREGKEAGIGQLREAQANYGRRPFDLAQIFSLTDLDTHWPTLQEWKAAGETRYIGVTVSQDNLHEALAAFLQRAQPDFVQMNYSITERKVEDGLLQLAADKGVAVIVNRPFMNGAYFQRLEGRALPEWAAELGAESWAQFSLKYILANPLVTCVLTETTNPAHMAENARAAFGGLPDAAARARMVDLIAQV